MLRLYETLETTDWRAFTFGISQGISKYAKGALSSFLIGVDSLSPPIRGRMITDTGILTVTGSYGDKRQRNNAIVHRDIEGTIYPKQFSVSGSSPLMISDYVTKGGVPVSRAFSPGFYDFSGTRMKDEHSNYIKDCHQMYAAYWNNDYYSFVTLSGTYTCVGSIYDPSYEQYDTNVSANYTYGCFVKPTTPGGNWRVRQKGGTKSFSLPFSTYRLAAADLRAQMDRFALENLQLAKSITTGASTLKPTSYRFTRTFFNEKNLWFGSHELAKFLPTNAPCPPDVEKSLYKTALTGQSCFSGNGIAYVSDLGKVGDSIRAILSLVADPTDPKKWAGAYLSARFSDRLTYQDSKELFSSLRGQLKRLENLISYRETRAVTSYDVNSSYFESGHVISRCRLRCDCESYTVLMTLVKKFLDWDAWLTLENAWDLIPLSFVVDWFIDLSTILTNVDTLIYQQYLKVRFYERSDKFTYRLPVSDVLRAFGANPSDFDCSVSAKVYTRTNAPRPQLGILDGWSPSLPAPVNYLDLDALLVQML